MTETGLGKMVPIPSGRSPGAGRRPARTALDRRPGTFAATAALLLATSACGGGESGGIVLTPPPAPAPSPSATPAPTAIAGGPTMESSDNPTEFPLTIAAVDRNLAEDEATNRQGASLTASVEVGTPRWRIDVANPSVGIHDEAAPSMFPGRILADGRELRTVTRDLDYTAFGVWSVYAPDSKQFIGGAGYAGGFMAPAGVIPESGTAQYQGVALAWSGRRELDDLGGEVTLTVDFAARELEGLIKDLLSFEGLGGVNDISFTATIDPARNLFSGTTRVAADYGILSPDATGTLTGHFFGPAAEEIGAAWTIGDDAHRYFGSFGATRQAP